MHDLIAKQQCEFPLNDKARGIEINMEEIRKNISGSTKFYS